MRTLVIDSATAACSIALFERDGGGSTCLAHDYRLLGRGHAEQLVPMIAALPEHGRAGRIAVALGPGSFTGVRVGLAAAKALAFAWGSALHGYPTLALVAAMARAQVSEPFSVMMTGGHGEWFVQRFATDARPLTPLASLTPDRAVETTTDVLIAGSEAQAAVARRGWGEALPLLPDAGAFPLLADEALGADVRPLYGREPDARPVAGATGQLAGAG